MTVQSWDTSLIGFDPTDHPRSVLVVPGADAIVDTPAFDELRGWGWEVTVVAPGADPATVAALAAAHDVAFFTDIRGTRAVRRILTPSLPTVALVPSRGHGRLSALWAEAGTGRDTTVLIVRDPRDAKILRRLSASALVRSQVTRSVRDRAAALAAVLLRAYAWQPGPVPVAAS